MNTEQLAKIATKNKTSEAIFTSWAVRERDTDEIDVMRTKNILRGEGFKIVPEELNSTLKELEKAGFGEFRMDKNGQPNRFRFNYSIKEMGKAALGEFKQAVAPVKHAPAVKPKEASKSSHYLVVMLADGRKVKVELPGDLSKQDILTITEGLLDASKL